MATLSLRIAGTKPIGSPHWDSTGTYRVVMAGNRGVIQRFDESSNWVPASLTPPSLPAASASPPTITNANTAGEPATETRHILFMDVSGWSKLTATEIHDYVTKAMPSIKPLLAGSTFVNTWGDAIVATFSSAKTAAESALAVRDFFRRSHPRHGVAAGLACRISLHQGEVLLCPNVLTGEIDIFGNAVHVAARLEPATEPGQVFCTGAFAQGLKDVSGIAPTAWELGSLELPKGFGNVEAYVLGHPNDKDPRPHLSIQAEVPPAPAPPADMSKKDRLIGLQAWINDLYTNQFGPAIKFTDVDVAARVPPGTAKKYLPEVLALSRYQFAERGDTQFILRDPDNDDE